MSSGFMDSLTLALSDNHKIPDSGLKKLSGILLEKGLSDSGSDLFVVSISSLVANHGVKFPVSISYMKQLWNTEYTTFKFTRMIAEMVKSGYFKLKKMDRNTFFSDLSIDKANNEEESSTGVYVSINPTKKFDDIYSSIREVLVSSGSILESFSFAKGLPNNVQSAMQRAAGLLSKIDINLNVESFVQDDVLKTIHVNLVFGNTSNYTCKDSDVLRIAKKYLSKCKSYAGGIEAYMDDVPNEVFVGLDLKSSVSMSDIPSQVFGFIEEMEMNCV